MYFFFFYQRCNSCFVIIYGKRNQQKSSETDHDSNQLISKSNFGHTSPHVIVRYKKLIWNKLTNERFQAPDPLSDQSTRILSSLNNQAVTMSASCEEQWQEQYARVEKERSLCQNYQGLMLLIWRLKGLYK